MSVRQHATDPGSQLYLMENFRHAFDMERCVGPHSAIAQSPFREHGRLLTLALYCSYVYYTQIMQAETLAAAYRLWRRNWKGRGREYTAGALVWQVRSYSVHPPPVYTN